MRKASEHEIPRCFAPKSLRVKWHRWVIMGVSLLLKREKALRNINISRILEIFCSLAPHGASGLKYSWIYQIASPFRVLLRMEQVDWNLRFQFLRCRFCRVLLRMEQVDWNPSILDYVTQSGKSCSAWSKWIEISMSSGVILLISSCSAWSKWIEMKKYGFNQTKVATLQGSRRLKYRLKGLPWYEYKNQR